jgi:hypothetical protein
MDTHGYLMARLDDESLVEFGKSLGVSKADEDKKYRSSRFAWANPRSKTEVRPGAASAARRGARFYGGGVAGSLGGQLAGGVVGGAKGRALGGLVGGAGGMSVGRTHNLKSGDTRAYRRSDGRKAKANIQTPSMGGYWTY